MRVFISHSSADKPAVVPLADALRARGIDAWLDQYEIAPSADIVARINAGLHQSDAGIIVFSPHSEKSPWVQAEVSYLTYARIQESKTLIPITLSADAYVPPLLRPLARLAITDLDKIIDALQNRRTGPPPVRPAEHGLIDPVLISLLRATPNGPITTEFHFRNQQLFAETHAAIPAPLEQARNTFLRGISDGVRSPADAHRNSLESNLATLGTELRAFCLPADSAAALTTILDGAPLGTTVEICFETADPTLLALPFEALRLSDGRPIALHPNAVILRRVAGLTAPTTPLLAGPIKILIAIGAPDEAQSPGTAVLDLERELQNILDAIQPAQLLENIEVRILEVGHPKVIADAIARDAYHILHLSCHGQPGGIILEDEEGGAVPTNVKLLLDPIRQTGRPLPMVLLSSCHGGVHVAAAASFAQQLLQSGVPAVLAMQTSVSDFYATRLSRVFYENFANRELLLPSRALAAARKTLEAERRAAVQQNAPLHETQPEYATAGLFVAGAERALANFGLDKQPLQRRPVYEVAGPVPQLRIDDLIGRRRELRTALRTLRDPKRQYAGVVLTGLGGVGKSALAGRIMTRLAEDKWFLAAHSGKLDFTKIADSIIEALPPSHPIAERLSQPNLKDELRLRYLAQALAQLPLLLVLDDFEQNLTPGGGEFLNPELANYLAAFAQNARRGRLLLTCRYPVPSFDAFLARVPVLPLSNAETRKLFLRLPALKSLKPAESLALMRTIGGHPRMFEFLDALMRGGSGRLPHVTTKLKDLCTQLGINPADDSRTLQQSLDDALKLGARDVFLAELLDITRANHWDEHLLQLAVSNLPVSPNGLARMFNENAGPPETRVAANAMSALESLSLVYRFPDQSALVHRWTAEGLAHLEGEQLTRARARRAGSYRWKLVDETHDIDDAVESVRNFLAARDFAAASAPEDSCLTFFANSNQTIRCTALASEILEILPETHDDFGWIANREADAHIALGSGELALNRWIQINGVLEQRAAAEPNRADLQRDLSVSYEKLGDLARALGQNDSALEYFQKSLAIAERLAAAEPNRADLQRDLSVSFNKLGDLARALGQNDSALQYFQRSLAIRERLAAAEPNRADLQRDLFVSYYKLNDFPRALAILEALKDSGRLNPVDEPWLAHLRELVQKSKSTNA